MPLIYLIRHATPDWSRTDIPYFTPPGPPLTGYPAVTYWSLIALALVTQVGGYLCINYALGHLPASIVSPTMLGQPVLTALLAVPLLGEPLILVQIGGGLLVLGGIWLIHQRPAAPPV
jgi:drug/metabolite transporter (DMT)-like permease